MATLTMPALEREIHDISRAALQLEKLTACSNSIPSPVHYQQILKRISELHSMWQEHRIHQRMQVSKLDVPDFYDELGARIEQQLNAVSTSIWPRTTHAGLCSIRVALPRILHLLYQQIASERALCATLIQRRNSSPMKSTMLVRSQAVLKVKQATA